MRVVASHVILPGGYHLLLGRESVRFESLVERFWYGITGAIVVVSLLGGLIGWLSHRALLNDVNEISRTALAISKGNLCGASQPAADRTNSTTLRKQSTVCSSSSPRKTCNSRGKSAYAGKQSMRFIVLMKILQEFGSRTDRAIGSH